MYSHFAGVVPNTVYFGCRNIPKISFFKMKYILLILYQHSTLRRNI